MPGILPMKVIKMGSNANMRVAQACDRCRSKKIRCDGIRPCCTQCASVGFECKTSDKLSRRAFPRGYTESLEERVRNLESEVKELKDLLDEKDEKIELLTRVYPYRQTSPAHLPSPKASVSSPSATSKSDPAEPADVTFKVEQSSNLACHGDAESYFAGTSSGTSFLEAFKQRAQEKSRSTNDVKPAVLLRSAAKHTQIPIGHTLSPLQSRPPPRLMTDQYINIFFQEWAPLFPVLHRPTFLESYESFTASPEAVTDRKSIAQLYLVFSLAVLSQNNPQSDTSALEVQWQAALQHVLSEQSLSVLQCLLLAQLFCMQKGDCRQMLTYKALAVSLSVRLGLHQSQKRFALGALTCETRKKVFWTLYTLDSFSAVVLGLPRQIKDDEVFCEYPADVDDEYVSDKGFQPPLPGESTRVSSALALFRAARILSKVVDQVYPALPSYELSRNQLSALSDELDQWQASLAPHLRLPFAQDKPTVGTVSSRSPLLSLTYHYVRFLINRPAACSRSVAASSAMIAMTGSCKHMAQIVALLHERGLSFSFCLNKEELLVISGFGLLLQDLDLDDNSKVLKDDQKTLALIIGQLDRMKVPVASSFRHIACSFLPGATRNPASDSPSSTSPQRQAPEFAVPAPQSCNISSSVKQQFKAMTQKFGWSGKAIDIAGLQRRMTSAGPYNHSLHAHSVPTLPQTEALPTRVPKSEPAGSPPHPRLRPLQSQRIPASAPQHETLQQPRASLNLDFLSFGNGGGTQMPETSGKTTNQSDWERLLAGLDNGQTNIFDNIYGGPPMEVLREPRKPQAPATVYSMQSNSMGNLPVDALAWDPEIWAATTADMSPLQMAPTLTESVASLSSNDESKESGNGNALGLGEVVDMDELERYGSLVMPDIAQNDDGTWDGRMGGALVHA